MKRAFALLLLTGCSTIVPMQTASVVERDSWRVGGQLSSAGLCNIDDVTKCNAFPDGIQLPELRLDARRGVWSSTDVGASVQVQPSAFSPEHPLQLGVTVDGKRELLRLSDGDNAYVLSAGLLAAGAVAGRFTLRPWITAQLGVPVFFGYQTRTFEIVAGASMTRAVIFQDVGGTQQLQTLHDLNFGFSLGYFRRAPSHWALQLAYLTERRAFSAGALQLQFGLFWDFPGRKGDAATSSRPSP